MVNIVNSHASPKTALKLLGFFEHTVLPTEVIRPRVSRGALATQALHKRNLLNLVLKLMIEKLQ